MTLSTLSVKSLWSVTRVTSAMAKGIRLRYISLKRAAALLSSDDLANSTRELGLTVTVRDTVREYDLQDAGVVAAVVECLTNRIVTTNEALMALNKAARDLACEKANAQRWHEVRIANVLAACQKRGLNVLRSEVIEATKVDDLTTCSAYIERILANRSPEPTTPAPAVKQPKGNIVKNSVLAIALAAVFSFNIGGAHAADGLLGQPGTYPANSATDYDVMQDHAQQATASLANSALNQTSQLAAETKRNAAENAAQWGSIAKADAKGQQALDAVANLPKPTNGKDGKDGRDGVDGKDGRDGHDGKDGAPGATGATGATGAAGANGHDGKDGAPGAAGANGKDGTNGKDGQPGAAGQNGKDGKKGDKGDAGADGQDGQDGTNGKDGKDFTPRDVVTHKELYRAAAGAQAAAGLHYDHGDGAAVALGQYNSATAIAVGVQYQATERMAFTLDTSYDGANFGGSVGAHIRFH